MVNFLADKGKLSEYQHGFRAKRSCETNLLETLDFVTNAIEENCDVVVTFMDFSKAFDKVSHSILSNKLWNIGVKGKLHAWIKVLPSWPYPTSKSK